jgi:hypothetical protein
MAVKPHKPIENERRQPFCSSSAQRIGWPLARINSRHTLAYLDAQDAAEMR